jgi:hypothetical protein
MNSSSIGPVTARFSALLGGCGGVLMGSLRCAAIVKKLF